MPKFKVSGMPKGREYTVSEIGDWATVYTLQDKKRIKCVNPGSRIYTPDIQDLRFVRK